MTFSCWKVLLLTIVFSAVCACDDGGGDAADVCISDVVVTENPRNRLSAYVSFTTAPLTRASIEVQGPAGRSWIVGPEQDLSTDHGLCVLGLHPESEYTFVVRATDAAGDHAETGPLVFETGPLPCDFPPIYVNIAEPERMQPGITLFNVTRWQDLPGLFWGYLIAVDEMGEVVWYDRRNFWLSGFTPLRNGNILLYVVRSGLAEIDWAGNLVNYWRAGPMGLDTLHHHVHEMPSGNLLSISSEMREIDGYPTEEGGTTSYNVVGDVIVELDREGRLLDTWSLFDYLDPYRVKPGFDSDFWYLHYGIFRSPKDWTHTNGVIYDETDGSLIISVRHQDWLIKISHDTGEHIWTLGEEGDFTIQGEGEWQYYQHAPAFTPRGTILVYDNGNTRPTIEEGEIPYTRVVEYSLDESSMTVTQVWEYRGDSHYYAPFSGDAGELENGNILIADGGLAYGPFTSSEDRPGGDEEERGFDHYRARIVEVTHGDSPERVFELMIEDEPGDDAYGFIIYQAARLPGLDR